jgi:hypothetical protein
VVVVDVGAEVVVVDDGRGVRPPDDPEEEVVGLVPDPGPVVEVVVEVVGSPATGSAGASVVVVVGDGSGEVVVVVGSAAGSVAGSVVGSGAGESVVEVVSVPGSGVVVSATACGTGTHATARQRVVRARPRRTRLSNTPVSRVDLELSDAVDQFGPNQGSVTLINVPKR